MEKVGVRSTKAVVSLKGEDRAKVTIEYLYRVIYKVSICAKMYDLELIVIEGLLCKIQGL